MKKLLLILTLSVLAFANNLQVGDKLPTITLNDQFEKTHTVAQDTKKILVAYDKDISGLLKDFLLAKEGTFLNDNNAVYIGDIRGMPSLISKFFAIPKMKKYEFSILFLDENHEAKFAKEEEKITVYTLENGKVTSVSYASNADEIAAIFN